MLPLPGGIIAGATDAVGTVFLHQGASLATAVARDTWSPPLTPRTYRSVRGRRGWVRCWLAIAAGVYLTVVAMTQVKWSVAGLCFKSWVCVTKMYACTFVPAVLWLGFLWQSTTQTGEVPLGLLASVWITTGTLSVGLCSLCNWAMVQLWYWVDPQCYITYPADNWPWEYTSFRCLAMNMWQWILTAGVIEEGFKFIVLLRLRSTPTKIRNSALWTRRACFMPAAWCLKLAESPLAVALCGVAAGGGLATTENFMYIFNADNIEKAFREGDMETSYGRIATSFAHMVWTGYAACGLAKFQFLPSSDSRRPRRKSSYLLTPIILHGLYNWCSTLQRCEAYEEVFDGQVYTSDGCYLPPAWRLVFRGGHAAVMLFSFYLWHTEFSRTAGDEEDGASDLELASAAATTPR